MLGIGGSDTAVCESSARPRQYRCEILLHQRLRIDAEAWCISHSDVRVDHKSRPAVPVVVACITADAMLLYCCIGGLSLRLDYWKCALGCPSAFLIRQAIESTVQMTPCYFTAHHGLFSPCRRCPESGSDDYTGNLPIAASHRSLDPSLGIYPLQCRRLISPSCRLLTAAIGPRLGRELWAGTRT